MNNILIKITNYSNWPLDLNGPVSCPKMETIRTFAYNSKVTPFSVSAGGKWNSLCCCWPFCCLRPYLHRYPKDWRTAFQNQIRSFQLTGWSTCRGSGSLPWWTKVRVGTRCPKWTTRGACPYNSLRSRTTCVCCRSSKWATSPPTDTSKWSSSASSPRPTSHFTATKSLWTMLVFWYLT